MYLSWMAEAHPDEKALRACFAAGDAGRAPHAGTEVIGR